MSRPTVSSVIALLALSACSKGAPTHSPVEALADEVPRPQMRVGDKFEYEWRAPAMGRDGGPSRWTITVIGVDADGSFQANVSRFDAIAGAPRTDVVRYAAPWNIVPPPPYAQPESLRFPLRQGASWTSIGPNPTINMTEAVSLTVKGRQTLDIGGQKVECVRVEGTQTSTSTLTITSPMRLWYCPSLRAVGRSEVDLPLGPATHTLVAHQLQP